MTRPKRADPSRPERPTSPPVRPVPAILERNLERYPWARLSENKGSLDELQLLLDAAGEEGRAWIVTASEAARLPGPFEADLYVALCQLYNERIPRERRATDRTITASFREVLALMGRERGGSQYAAVREGLERLADARVRAVQTWRVGELVAREERFSIIQAVTYEHRRGEEQDNSRVTVMFSEPVAASIAAGNIRVLDTATYVALDTPTAKRLYRYLDQRRWQGPVQRRSLTLPLQELVQRVPIDRTSPSHVRRTLDPAHEELIASGYLTRAAYEERPVEGKRRKVVWVSYTFAHAEGRADAGRGTSGSPSVASDEARRRLAQAIGLDPIAAARAPVSDLAWWVHEIERTLGDRRSSGFYKQVVEAFANANALDALEFVLRGVARDGVGMGAKALGSAFTARVKARVRELGISLPGAVPGATGVKRVAGVTAVGALLPGFEDAAVGPSDADEGRRGRA